MRPIRIRTDSIDPAHFFLPVKIVPDVTHGRDYLHTYWQWIGDRWQLVELDEPVLIVPSDYL